MVFNQLDANDQQGDDISTIYIYKMFLAKEKALYQTMNMMKMQNTTFIGYFWAPADQETEVMNKIAIFPTVRMVRYDNHTIPRPTYIKTNEATATF
jgi:vacuolar-type H+-ATPase subunit I/STV1